MIILHGCYHENTLGLSQAVKEYNEEISIYMSSGMELIGDDCESTAMTYYVHLPKKRDTVMYVSVE